MKQFLTTFTFLSCLVFALADAQAENDTNIIAVGQWFESVLSTFVPDSGPIRGRLIITYGYSPCVAGRELPETQVFLELQNLSMRNLEVYFDPRNGLKSELQDWNGKRVRRASGPGSGQFPSAYWIMLPYDATIRLRASWYGYGLPRNEGLMVPLYEKLYIPPGDTNDYFLAATFAAASPAVTNREPERYVWEGKLEFPKIKISSRVDASNTKQ